MCGILGVINKSNQSLDLASCRRSLSCLTQRGPDLSTYEVWDNRIFLGQTILSISGNIKKTDDHLTSVSQRYKILANGEIYNYQELHAKYLFDLKGNYSSDTDTSVLVNLNERLPITEVAKLLDGMYAFVLLDKKEKKLHVCRDIQGEKSLYIYEDTKVIIISSEILPILQMVPYLKPDPQVLRDYFHTRHFMFLDRTIYPGIRQIRPGYLETMDLNFMKFSQTQRLLPSNWIDPKKMEKNEKRSLDDLTDELDVILAKGIKDMIPARKFASVVSGGVDSTLISYYIKQISNPDILVAVNHVGKDVISDDLLGFEKAFNQKIHRLDVDLFSYSREIIRSQRTCQSPLMAHSFVGQSIQSAYVRSHQCRVLFGGDGADELFGGYACYHENRQINESRFSSSPYTACFPSKIDFDFDQMKNLEDELAQAWTDAKKAYQHIQDPLERIVQAMMYIDFSWQLPAVGLRGSDLMSLMWGIETRSLFIRRSVAEFALNLPLNVKSDPMAKNVLMRAKPILKKLFLRYFPAELLKEKQGFSGFPNESAFFIGPVEDYLALDFLGIKRKAFDTRNISKDAMWKLVNIEYFLREKL